MSLRRMKGFWRSLAVWAREHVNEDLPVHMSFSSFGSYLNVAKKNYPYRKQWEHTGREIIGKTDLSFLQTSGTLNDRCVWSEVMNFEHVLGGQTMQIHASVQSKFGDIMTQVGVVSYCQVFFGSFLVPVYYPPNTRVVNKIDFFLPQVGFVCHLS